MIILLWCCAVWLFSACLGTVENSYWLGRDYCICCRGCHLTFKQAANIIMNVNGCIHNIDTLTRWVTVKNVLIILDYKLQACTSTDTVICQTVVKSGWISFVIISAVYCQICKMNIWDSLAFLVGIWRRTFKIVVVTFVGTGLGLGYTAVKWLTIFNINHSL